MFPLTMQLTIRLLLYIELYSYLLFYCCIAECEVEGNGEEVEEEEVDDWTSRSSFVFNTQVGSDLKQSRINPLPQPP